MHRLIPILLVTACASSELEENRALWATNGSDDYTMTVAKSCFCPDFEPVDVVVVDGATTSAIRQTDTGPVTLEPPYDFSARQN